MRIEREISENSDKVEIHWNASHAADNADAMRTIIIWENSGYQRMGIFRGDGDHAGQRILTMTRPSHD